MKQTIYWIAVLILALAVAGCSQPTPAPAPPLPPFSPRPEEVRRFLLREIGLLRAAEAGLRASLAQGRGPAPELAAVEYVLLCTPEADPERLAERGNLGLGLANAGRLRGALERLAGVG